MKNFILIFESIHHVLKAEKILATNKISFDIIPTPKEFSSDCGMSVRVSFSEDMEMIKSLLKKNNLNFKIHEKE
ncbi:MAG TPA: DUF3343 domain-containing protein [Bacteroidales bacterium]|nr:DUF3343 domain-containing protein [Bacteroidales bacterium]HPS16495.1 DUF3343 domain-containing protein [Bacteroidales bacterium]